MSEIVDVLWGARPPHSAVNVIRRHVGALRRLLEPGLPARSVGRWPLREAGGYRLVIDGGCSDLLRFRELCEQARRAETAVRTVEVLTEALALWRGPVASGIPGEARAHPAFAAVESEHPAAVREAARAALRAGVPDSVLPELRKAADEHPLDEPLSAALILALAATGRRSEALSAYETTRARLSDELGIDPGPELSDAHRSVLNDTLTPDDHAPARPGPPIPAQLPHDIPAFTGRIAELNGVLALLPGDDRPTGTVVISAIGGMAGVGKTTLAVHRPTVCRTDSMP
ncbi:BTAD domain-containing putative transcriptional regulator [Streptomyces sp. NPDC001982]|uniref:AfsR/SARP family transcriptional regulator n=1 Tax=Streptomyces sp. NPDC001982 TaxID=3154405 RepID=UPI003318F378